MPPTPHPVAVALLSRAFNDGVTQAQLDCPRPIPSLVGTGDPLFGKDSINLHQLMVYVSAGCLGVTLISCWFLSWRHIHRYTSPQEQRQILRIVNLPLFYCLFNFLALTFTIDYMYIQPLSDVYEAFSVAALFFLILEFIAPDGTDREAFFANTELRTRTGKPQPGGSLTWFKTIWASVLQYPLLKTILIIIQIITQYFGDFCESSFSFKHAHLWLTLADYLFVGGALGAVIRFSMRFKKEYNPIHRARPKVWTFLGILFFQIIQGLLFNLLNGKLFHPSRTATYNDINFGISSFMTCIESVVFSLIMHWSFSSTQYKEGAKLDRYGLNPAERIPTFRAIGNALNLSDIVAGTIIAIRMLVSKAASRYGSRLPVQRGGGGGVGGGYGNLQDTHLEPLSSRRNVRGKDYGVPEYEEQDGYETQYAAGYHAPPMPPAARDPSPGAAQGRNQTFRADELRPEYNNGGSYDSASYGRRPSGDVSESAPLAQTRSFA